MTSPADRAGPPVPEGPLALERGGPLGGTTVLLLHAGVADRRMWDPVWGALTAGHDVVRVDLRGYGESDTRPDGLLDPVADVVATLRGLGVTRALVVGASYGAGVAVGVALEAPELVGSLLLLAPGGALVAELTEQLGEFVAAERAALAADDLDAAVEANLATWVDGPGCGPERVEPEVRESVRRMQRRAFEIADGWERAGEVEEAEPAVLERLGEVAAPTTVLLGGLDVDAIAVAGRLVVAQVPGARLVTWPDVAHLPSMERPDDVVALVTLACRPLG